MGLLEGLKNRVAAKLSIHQESREEAEKKIDRARMDRENQARQTADAAQVKIIKEKARGEISPELADKLSKRREKEYEKAKQLPGDRLAKGAGKVTARLKTEAIRSGKDLLRYSRNTTGIKKKEPEKEIRKEKIITDKNGKTTTTRTYRTPPKLSQPRGRPRSYHAPRGGFKAPSYGSGGGMPRMPPMNFDMGFGAAPKKKQKGGKKSPLDPFNFDMDF